MKKLTLLLIAVSLFVASPVMAEEQQAELETTYYLLNACMDVVYQDDTLTTSVYCRAFIKGAINTHKYYTSYYNFPKQYCLPKGLTEREIIGIFIKFVQVVPGVIDNPALATLHDALNNAFSCAEPESSKYGSIGAFPRY